MGLGLPTHMYYTKKILAISIDVHIGLKIDIYVPYCLDTCNKYLYARVSKIFRHTCAIFEFIGEYQRYSTGHGN